MQKILNFKWKIDFLPSNPENIALNLLNLLKNVCLN